MDDVIKDMLEAERQAKAKVKQAETQGQDIRRKAHEQAQEMLAKAQREAHDQARQLVAAKRQQAQAERKRLLDECGKENQAVRDAALGHREKATALAVEALSGASSLSDLPERLLSATGRG